jgi:hypothetical protein
MLSGVQYWETISSLSFQRKSRAQMPGILFMVNDTARFAIISRSRAAAVF